MSSTREEQADAHLLDVPQCSSYASCSCFISTVQSECHVNSFSTCEVLLKLSAKGQVLRERRLLLNQGTIECLALFLKPCPCNEKRFLFGLNTHSYAENCSSSAETSFLIHQKSSELWKLCKFNVVWLIRQVRIAVSFTQEMTGQSCFLLEQA